MEEIKEERESMVFYKSFLESINCCQDKNLKLECYEAIINYGLYNKTPQTNNDLVLMFFKIAKASIDSAKTRYDKCVENGKKGAEYGKLGGAPIGNQNARKKDVNIKKIKEVDLSDNIDENVVANKKTDSIKQKQPQNNPKLTPKQPLTDTYTDTETDTYTETETETITETMTDYDTKTITLNEIDNVNENMQLNISYNKENKDYIFSEDFLSFSNIFNNNFPNKNMDIGISKIEEINKININNLDINLLTQKINASDFLKSNNNLGFCWCLLNYSKIIMGYYDNYNKEKNNNTTTENYSNSRKQEYLKKLNDGTLDLFVNLNDPNLDINKVLGI